MFSVHVINFHAMYVYSKTERRKKGSAVCNVYKVFFSEISLLRSGTDISIKISYKTIFTSHADYPAQIIECMSHFFLGNKETYQDFGTNISKVEFFSYILHILQCADQLKRVFTSVESKIRLKYCQHLRIYARVK